MKMQMRVRSGLSCRMATILPSAGETATGPEGTTRSGSRKKYRQKAAARNSGTP